MDLPRAPLSVDAQIARVLPIRHRLFSIRDQHRTSERDRAGVDRACSSALGLGFGEVGGGGDSRERKFVGIRPCAMQQARGQR